MDTKDRQAFIQNTDTNYSVIAPAGVGKTQAIVDRIVSIASHVGGRALLERLVVVTYTRKAAQEIQVRVREGILDAGLDPLALQSFNKAFFGTTHSFCLNLLQEYGPHKGLPAQFAVLESQQERVLWSRFLQEEAHLSLILPESARKPLLQCIDLWSLLDRPLEASGGCVLSPQPFSDSLLRFEVVLGYTSENKRTQAVVARAQDSLRDWLARFSAGEPHLGLPDDYAGKDSEFEQLWNEALLPLKDWVAHNSLVLACGIRERFLRYQVDAGVLSYAGLLKLARELFDDEEIRTKIREQGLCVILDEAQDATTEQLEILLGVAGVADPGLNFLSPQDRPGGRFCMVGDPQQSIYGLGSDLPLYLQVHQKLQSTGWAEALQFKITFRCDEAIVNAVNALFPGVLTSSIRGQVDFEVLEPRPNAGLGQVVRLDLGGSADVEDPEFYEACAIARWVKHVGLSGLRAQSWDRVALLAPRNDWLPTLRKAFDGIGFSCQDHTRTSILADNPAYAWLCALITVMNEPWNTFELVGVLREVFGVKDTDIARYTHACGPLTLLGSVDNAGDLGESLTLLRALRETILSLGLREAVGSIVTGVDLRSRLAMLEGYSPKILDAKLDELLVQASLAEEVGVTFGGFARSLRERLECQDVETTIRPGHIQLVSCHSAKGLQWDAVILPYFYRKIAFSSGSYPQVWSLDGSEPPMLVLDKQHKEHRLAEEIRLNQHQELERLLYVAATRAKHTLVFVDNAPLYESLEGSFADVLKVLPGACNHKAWEQLSALATPESGVQPLMPDAMDAMTDPPYFDWKTLLEQAASGLERLTPSGLTHGSEKEETLVLPASAGSNTGAEYGTFWHEVMEVAPWSSGREAFRQYCSLRISQSPDPKRFESEIVRFLGSPLAQLLLSQEWWITCEMPFLWRSDSTCYEGIMDLVARHHATGAIKVVDWKTDLVPEGEDSARFLVDRYAPQIRIYQQALSAWQDQPVEGILYSTRLGDYAPLS